MSACVLLTLFWVAGLLACFLLRCSWVTPVTVATCHRHLSAPALICIHPHAFRVRNTQQVNVLATKIPHMSHLTLPAGPGWPQFDPLPQGDMSALLLSHALHIIPSEREGFGHSINEGRAAGAVLLVPDHPPMNELVRQSAGLLMRPAAVFSHADDPVPVLGKYGNISASMSPQVSSWALAMCHYALTV